jgi:serine O-acetyltransferase
MNMSRPNPCRLTLVHPDESAAVTDALWARLRAEAEEAYQREPKLASLFFDSILNQPSFETAVFHRVAVRMRNDVVSLPLIVQAFAKACIDDPCIVEAAKADIAAVLDRDPACSRLLEPLLYFKGFHAIQAHRLNHWLWHHGERDFALYLQSRSSEVFQTDIHPNAKFGMGIFVDHATGLVVGETAEVGDNVSLLQGVTLGGTGKDADDRHPKVRQGVVIGAAAKVLGNIEIGEHSRIAAGSVVLKPVPPHATVAGVPAKIVRVADTEEPARSMDQML